MLTLYTARSIITMNDSLPRATAILVRDGLIIEVGEAKNMQPWFEHDEVLLDTQFADKIICPGLYRPTPSPEHGSGALAHGVHYCHAVETPLGGHRAHHHIAGL